LVEPVIRPLMSSRAAIIVFTTDALGKKAVEPADQVRPVLVSITATPERMPCRAA
jgi:hypothetical protein